MDREDRRRYFIVGSVILEIVTPVFRQRLVKDYKGKGLGSLQDFINSKPVVHILFHLRHKNTKCCVDSAKCVNHGPLPLNYSQWDLLYTGPPNHHCFCKFTAKSVTLDDLDITLASLILMNCCNLTPNELSLVSDLRQFKNNYLSHNTKGAITQAEYTTLFGDLTTYVLQLDPSKQDDFIRIQNRSLDDSLCNKYVVFLLDIHQKLEEIDTRIQKIGATTADIHSTSTEILSTMNINNAELESKIMAKLEEVLQQLIKNQTSKRVDQSSKPYKLGKSIFKLHHPIHLKSAVCGGRSKVVTDIMMMDDGRLVICLPNQNRLLFCNTNGSKVDHIHVQDTPWRVTAVNNSTVAVTLVLIRYIEMYDINNKLKLKSISVPEMWWNGRDITTINNKLVLCGSSSLLIIDHQTGEVVQTIQTDCDPVRLHGSGDRIFYSDYTNNLSWYSYTDDTHHTLTLPSCPSSMTTLQDGSMYVMCGDKYVHVSSDGKQYKPVKTIILKSMDNDGSLFYNCKQRKLVTCYPTSNINIFHEK